MPNCGAIEIIYARFGGERAVAHLYAHWKGCLLPFLVRDALGYALKKHRSDPRGVPREVYRMFQQYQWAETTLDPIGGLQHHRVDLDFIAGEVRLVDDYSDRVDPDVIERWTLEEFLALTDEEVEAAYHGPDGMLPDGWAELSKERAPFVLGQARLLGALGETPPPTKPQRQRSRTGARARRTANTTH